MSTHAQHTGAGPAARHIPSKTVQIRIKRRENPDAPQYWEEFEIPYRPNLNIISCLMEIQKNPVTKEGKRTTPPVWNMNCLEQVCGICTMVINGRVRQSCSALVDQLDQPITLEPMSKFPNVRDLIVDRQQMFDHLKRVHAWIEIDGSYDLGPGPKMDQETVAERYAYSRCMTCGCCLEACPQYEGDQYIGPQAIAQVRLFNMHPSGQMTRDERLEAIMGDDGITNCGNAQNCVQVCPMSLPLTKAIYEENRETILYGLFGWLRK
ncbi:MAG: succinate dehydrogenase / fumarate reductase, iron-sulfur subunit [Blastocatellia bacterium]|jgi:succinate dehydrogenase / fumarate reductase iron-sulfur subunit|nr:succinate dehydrogenase / fumarate reductase, iron-sulfur subunit [Blastocatellia bacterium]